jgi:fructose-1,6-bisphosphatase II
MEENQLLKTYMQSFAPSPALTTLRTLEPMAADATRAAAVGSAKWAGRGDDKAADAAATEAMREALGRLPANGTVIIGEGEKDKAPMLFNGEQLGEGGDQSIDIAVDPLECTDFCAAGVPGALATIAFAEQGTMWSPGPGLYMEKLVVGPEAREVIDLDDTPDQTVTKVAEALGKQVEEVRVVVLDKPRHEGLIERLRGLGVAVSAPTDGDVAGALEAIRGQADILMGVGGTPEGVMTACAVRALGGGMKGRLAPQKDEEAEALADAGMDTEQILDAEDIVGGEALFCATGVTGGPLVREPWDADGETMTETIVITPGKVQRIVESIVEQTWIPAEGPGGGDLAS